MVMLPFTFSNLHQLMRNIMYFASIKCVQHNLELAHNTVLIILLISLSCGFFVFFSPDQKTAKGVSVDKIYSRSVDLVRSRLRDQDKTTDGRGILEWQGTAAGHLEGTQGVWGQVRLLLCTFYNYNLHGHQNY